MTPPRTPRVVAAADLGSNSFHMVVATVEHGRLHVVDRLKERVALAAGLDAKGDLTDEVQERALACIARLGQRLRDMPAADVRAVGTNALRQAKNARAFLARAEPLLGHVIEVIPGREEARLIYEGVVHTTPLPAGRRLVVDIGGGSTECILGRDEEPLLLDSLYMGCVTWSLRFFPGGRVTRKAMSRARLAARREVRTIRRRFLDLGWNAAVGSSGTILAVDAILAANRWSKGGVTRAGLKRLRNALVDAGGADRVELAGLEDDRRATIAGGVAILSAVFDGLRVERLKASQGALREGVLHDLLGRAGRADVRDRTVEAIATRFGVDRRQAQRVARTAATLHAATARAWGLDAESAKILAWAARVHEIGLSIAYSGHHKHGAYLLANADLAGFSRDDRALVAAVVLGHRRKVHTEAFDAVPAAARTRAFRLAVLLRVAAVLHRSRSARRLPRPQVRAGASSLRLRFGKDWLARHPLTHADLDDERRALADAGFDLRIR